jgi:oxygen-independent coproporphyrinogen-3 oxidase
MPDYLDALIKEINATKKMIFDNAFVLRTIYIGGGTPTVLTAEQLDLLLSNLNYPVSEFTVECGRPDTITQEKLEVLKKHGVTRISINPQTFNDSTLKKIGRKHTVKDVINAYKIALPFEFNVNMDLIAGLGGESLRAFKKSVDTAIELAPDNITVHTLSIKNGSQIMQNGEKNDSDATEKMVEYASTTLSQNGYKPYYLYRQKNQCGGQENVGYFREKVCLFNVDSMEESLSILACGANAISKRIYHYENKIERFANVKDINEYINRIDEMIDKKKKLYL